MRRPWRLTTLAWLAFARGAMAQTQLPPPVTVATAARQDVPVFANGVGTVQAYRAVLVRARVDGTLEKIHFVEGQDVKPGAPLAEIDPRPYQAVLDQARAKRAADTAQLANQRLDLLRYASLARTNFASKQQVDTQQAAINQQLATLQGDDAAIEAAALNVEYCDITSPIEGVVGIRLVDEGNLIHATDTTGIVTITQVHPISLLFTLPESEFSHVQEAMQAARGGPGPLVLAYANEGGKLLSKGTLLTPSNSIDTTTGTIQLKATFDNSNRALWPGQFVAARVQLSVAHNAVTVPANAVQHGPDGLYVYAMTPDHVAHRHDVKTGYEGDGLSVVTQGLEAGETVIVSGQVRVNDGEKVEPRTQAAG